MSKTAENAHIAAKYVTHHPRVTKDKKRYSKRAKGPLAKLLALIWYVAILAVAACLGVVYVNWNDEVGYAGIISAKANGIAMSCGGEYYASSFVVFHPTLPCDSYVQVLNPENGRKVMARVASNKVMYHQGNGRVADISEGVAQYLGMNLDAYVPPVVTLRPNTGLGQYVPLLAGYHHDAPAIRQVRMSERNALTQNLLGECAKCGQFGMVGVGQVTLNRWEQRFNGKSSIESVVFDANQFSWTLASQDKWPGKGTSGWVPAYVLAGQVLTDQLSGDALAVQYWVSRDATYYYAFDVIATPYWGKRSGKLEVVPMSNQLEVELWHRYYRGKGITLPSSTETPAILSVRDTSPEVSLPKKGPVPARRPARNVTTASQQDDVKNLIQLAG